jgi:uncharacterized protein (TIGR02270 family)
MLSPLERPIGFRPEEISAMINEVVVEQHAENAAFLWLLRDHAVVAPHYSLKDLAELDERVEANVDGLRVAGDYGWRLCEQALGEKAVGEVFAAGILAFENGQQPRIDAVLEVAAAAPELERGLISALAWTPVAGIGERLAALVMSDNPAVRRIGLAANAVRREDPGPHFPRLLKDNDPRVRARALRAVAELGRRDMASLLVQALRDADHGCRFSAAWSAARFAQRQEPVISILVDVAQQAGTAQRHALAMAVRCLDVAAAKAWLKRLWQDPQFLRLATMGIGVLGDPELAGVLIELMHVNEVARVAGESFSMMTGVDLAYDDLEKDPPEDFQSGPTEDESDENVALDDDENLAWPDAELVAKWWSANASRFQTGKRHLCGREISVESAKQTLTDGKQRQRAAAAIELAIRQPSEPLFEVRARGSWQQERLKSWTS